MTKRKDSKYFFQRYYHDIAIAAEAIQTNKMRSILTALGIIFGVAAVISMLAIGNGARQEILEQMERVGVNNILIESVIPQNESGDENGQNGQQQRYSPGLTMKDVDAIAAIVPHIKQLTAVVEKNTFAVYQRKRNQVKLLGVQTAYFDLYEMQLADGAFFNDYQNELGAKVCIIDQNVKTNFFSRVNPLGHYLKCGNEWLKVIGVLDKSSKGRASGAQNGAIYIPANTMLLRYTNRALVNAATLKAASENDEDEEQNTEQKQQADYHQVNQIVVQMEETAFLLPATNVLERLLLRRHNKVPDYEITVPELLLKQQQATKDIFNLVLGAIASISLIVGGIGIMNIMLASVLERVKEIGTRLAIGAKRKDIVIQFIAESTLISVSGGIAGIILGIVLSEMIARVAGILTIVSFSSVLIAFGVSVSVGIIFGYLPAQKAARQDPVVSLRS